MGINRRLLRPVAALRRRLRHLPAMPGLRRRLAIAVGVAIFILVADYFAGNLSFPIFDSSADLGLQAFIKDFYDSDSDRPEIFSVNTSHDTALAAAIEYGDTTGYVAVSDRFRILDFLRIAARADYRYIILDIRFEDTLRAPGDSLLFAQIASMPRIVFSRHREEADDDAPAPRPECLDAISGRGAFADFRSTWTDGFSRYEFLQDGNESVALRLYSDVDGRSIRPTWWGGYVDSDGSLCRNMQFIPFPKSASESIGERGEIRHRYLGHHVLGMNTPDELRQQLDGKVILIGNFDDDRHDTYIGDVPGTLIQYYAWKLLERGGHKINWWLQIFLFVFYTLSVLAIISPYAVYRPQRLFMVIVKALVGWSLVFFILKSLIYWLTGQSFITLIPALTFTTLTLLTTISATRHSAPTPTPGTAPISERRPKPRTIDPK